MAPNCLKQSIGPAHRLALEMLADAPGGCDGEAVSAYHGVEILAGLVRDGLVIEQLETMRAGDRTIEVVRAKITDDGWQALIGSARSE
ncbi:MAG TPA: hypothetical protein VKP67_24395 [Xanthobacteraceae bacterium]|nr:hypothetical protein [Xanthobacteraceae bacterium]